MGFFDFEYNQVRLNLRLKIFEIINRLVSTSNVQVNVCDPHFSNYYITLFIHSFHSSQKERGYV